jgi:hypothetical protein
MTILSCRLVLTIWLIASIGFAYMSSLSGDSSIVGGWFFLVITMPFGLLWHFYLYDHANAVFPGFDIHLAGQLLVIVFSYVFWFILVPSLRKVSRRATSRNE